MPHKHKALNFKTSYLIGNTYRLMDLLRSGLTRSQRLDETDMRAIRSPHTKAGYMEATILCHQ